MGHPGSFEEIRGRTDELLTMKRRLQLPKIALIAIPIAVLAAIYCRLTWVSEVPKQPAWMPSSSAWISGPHTPLEFSRPGEWVGCSANSEMTARCWFTNYKGAVIFEGEFAPVDGNQIHTLRISHGETPDFRFFSKERNMTIRLVRLSDGAVLAPVNDRVEFPSIRGYVGGASGALKQPGN